MKKSGLTIKSFVFVTVALFMLLFNTQTLFASNIMTSTDPYTGQSWSIRVDGTTATVVKFTTGSQWDFTIPSTVRGFQNTTLTIVGIEREAFKNSSLRTLTIPDTVTSIGENAFFGCSSLTTVNMPARLNSLGDHAFISCHSLQSITIPEGITKLSSGLFYGCTNLTSVILPNSLTEISGSAFGNCESLTAINIPAGVTKIGEGAFSGCKTLSSIVIPTGITTIYNRTFQRCTSLTNVTLPEGITHIGDQAFEECTSLEGIDLPDSLRHMGMFLFYKCTALKSITIPGNVTYLDATFKNCSSLTNVSIPMSVRTFGSSVFAGCSSLKSITIPDSVVLSDGLTFKDCTSLESIKFSSHLNSISSYDFYNCTSLKRIVIPENIGYIGDHAFDCCSNLTEAYFLGDAPYTNYFGVHVFDNTAEGFKIKYLYGKEDWSNPFHGYPAQIIYDLNDIPDMTLPIDINVDLENIPADNTPNVITLTAHGGVGFIKLDWNSISSSKEITGYNVYKATSSGAQSTAPTAANLTVLTYIDPDVVNGTTYYYTVKPVFADNSTGTVSNEVSASPQKSAGSIQLSIDNPIMSGNGIRKEIDSGFGTAPVIRNGSTFLPIRALITEMGGNIEWNGTEKKLTITYDGITLELWIGNTTARINGINTTLTTAPYISETGRTMLPLRFIGESLNCDVTWDADTKSITINYDSEADNNTAESTPSVTPSGIPESLPAPTLSNLKTMYYDDGMPYFRVEVTIPSSVIALNQQAPSDGWVNLEIDGKIDDQGWGVTGGGGGHLDLFADEEYSVPGKTNTYYLYFDLEDEGGLNETIINERTYTYRVRFGYAYYDASGELDETSVFSPWSNELSGQSESFYLSYEEE